MRAWLVPSALFAATFASTLYVGAGWAGHTVHGVADLVHGWTFAVPLMGILLTHELAHFVAGRRHGIDVSPPFFIPAPIFLFGTLGAVIRIRDPIRRRDALLDVGAAGPLAGLCVAVPVLVYGLLISPVAPLPSPSSSQVMLIEGRSLLYATLLFAIKGPIPEGQDIMLSPPALAGWAGLLVTMINLVPAGQLDGGHVAYALLGPRQNRISRVVRRSLPVIAGVVGLFYGVIAYVQGVRGLRLVMELMSGLHWPVWAGVLWLMVRGTGINHPPVSGEPLSPRRKRVAVLTLALFVLLFMPAWIRESL